MAYVSYTNIIWELTCLNGGISKTFYKGVSCIISDFTRMNNKVISRYGPYALNWLR